MKKRERVQICFDDVSLTEQHHKDSCDINKIMSVYDKTGIVPVMTSSVPKYDDFSSVTDFHTAMELVVAAQNAFDSLPANVRDEFNHDPARFVSACEDPSQRDRLKRLGLLVDDGSFDGRPSVELVSSTSEGST